MMTSSQPRELGHGRRIAAAATLLAGCLMSPAKLYGISLTADPSITIQPNAPLAALLEFSTDVPTNASFLVRGPDERWIVQSSVPKTDHSIPVYGMKANAQYSIERLHLDAGGGETAKFNVGLAASTDPLPAGFLGIDVFASKPAKMETGYTIVTADGRTAALDASGAVRWFMNDMLRGATQQPNGLLRGRVAGDIRQYNLLGNVVASWHNPDQANPAPGSVLVSDAVDFHHDEILLPNGNLLALDRVEGMVDNFPTSDADPLAPTATRLVERDIVREFTPGGVVVQSWDLADMLDPVRIGYGVMEEPPAAQDWSHSNAVVYDESDDSILVSVRHQDAVIKFDRASGDLRWILGPHENWGPEFQQYLLTPTTQNGFEWPYHTHSPQILPDDPSNPDGPDDPNLLSLMIHDNGNNRAVPFDPPVPDEENYSRAVEFQIDQENMTIEQVWQYGKDAEVEYFSRTQGDADWQPETNNVLIDFADVSYANGTELAARTAHVIEVTREGEVVFGVRLFDVEDETARTTSYRAVRIPSFYVGTEFSAEKVPEPSSWLLGSVAVSALLLRRAVRSRKRRQSGGGPAGLD